MNQTYSLSNVGVNKLSRCSGKCPKIVSSTTMLNYRGFWPQSNQISDRLPLQKYSCTRFIKRAVLIRLEIDLHSKLVLQVQLFYV